MSLCIHGISMDMPCNQCYQEPAHAEPVGGTPRTDNLLADPLRFDCKGVWFAQGMTVRLLEHARQLERELKREKYAYDAAVNSHREYLRSVQAAVVNTIGGTVEGKPTHEGNYLQRLREFAKAEREVAELRELLRDFIDVNPRYDASNSLWKRIDSALKEPKND